MKRNAGAGSWIEASLTILHAELRRGEEPMPIYDYRCKDCDHEFYLIESLEEHEEQERRKRTCPECGSSNVERRITAPYVHTAKKF
jgi:putative FmdB family regulatory protein